MAWGVETMKIISILELKPLDTFRWYISKDLDLSSDVYILLRFDDIDGETIPIAKRILSYWLHNKSKWVEAIDAHEETFNPSALVQLGEVVDDIWWPFP